jgi:phenylacetate-CoA ligase
MKTQMWKMRLYSMGGVMPNLNEYSRSQWLDREQIDSLRRDRLERLLNHAFHHVPYYRRVLLDAGVADSRGMVNLDNFPHIPLLDKSAIRSHREDLTSDDLPGRKPYENTSGGSTGEPVRLVQDRESLQSHVSLAMLHDAWSGYAMGERKAVLWGSERDLFVGKEKFRTSLGRWLRNEIWLNAFRMTREQMGGYVQRINAFRPAQILAYAESIYDLARFIESANVAVHQPGSIMTSAGVLYPEMRGTIERVFRAPVFNRYGSREVGTIACECDRHEGLHVLPLTHHVEILGEDGLPTGPGETGEIVITHLANYSMPLIRYRIGDIGTWSEDLCACGRVLPSLKTVSGRVSDIFVTKEGARIHGEYFTHLFYFRNWVNKFQVIQEKADLIRVLIVPQDNMERTRASKSAEIDEITGKIRFVMGEGCRVLFEFAENIEPTASGKYRYTISKVRGSNGGTAGDHQGRYDKDLVCNKAAFDDKGPGK